MKARLWLGCVILSVIGLLVVALRATPARASGVVGSGTPGSCDEAALDSALAGGGAVTFNCGGAVTITFSAEKVITANTTIYGTNGGLGRIVFSGGGTVRLFHVTLGAALTLQSVFLRNGYAGTSGGALLIDSGGLATIYGDVLFEHNSTTAHGGAIENYGSLRLWGTNFISNTAGLNGGAVDSTGALGLNGAIFIQNWAGYRGGGVNNYLGTVAQDPSWSEASTFLANYAGMYGGALVNDSGVLTLTAAFRDNHSNGTGGAFKNSGPAWVTGWFSGNVSLAADGGAIWNDQPLRVTRSTFEANQASNGGAIITSGPLTVSESLFTSNQAGNQGGGIRVGTGTPAVIMNSSFSGNRGLQGQTIFNIGGLSIYSSTFTNNGFANSGNGGVIETWVSLKVVNSTFAQNAGFHGGAIMMQNGTIAITNSTFISHTAGSNGGTLFIGTPVLTQSVRIVNTVISGGAPNNCDLPVLSLGGNADSGTTCGFNQPSDQSNANAQFIPLGSYGGALVGFDGQTPLWTAPPARGSPLIDAALGAACPPTDQRGVPRPLGAGCDIGAVEVRPPVFLPVIRR